MWCVAPLRVAPRRTALALDPASPSNRGWGLRARFVVGERSDMLRSTGRTKKFREDYVRRRARELAKSDRFESWQSIEFELRYVEGLSEVRICLGSEAIREELDVLCRQAKSRRPPPPPASEAPK
jgi:hypothetical protein